MEACEQPKGSSSQVENIGNSINDNPKSSLEAESWLQSLGFMMNDGKPRFRLDDNIPTYSQNGPPGDINTMDEEDTLSFVVLGRSSLDLIQASSLASYVDIQQKSMSIDCNSIISSLNSAEINQKLTELLQENAKLKETLKQNNIAMKQQFNTLATWQEEVMKIHQNHKKKFAETRELINYLKKENAELKMRVSLDRCDNTEMGYKIINSIDLEDEPKGKESPETVPELRDKIASLTEELNNYKITRERLVSNTEKLLSTSNLMSSQLKQATTTIQEQRLIIKRLEQSQNKMTMSSSSVLPDQEISNSYTNSISCKECFSKDKSISSLKESVTQLEHKLEHATTPVQFCIKNPVNSRQYEEQRIDSIRRCNNKFQEASSCFNEQIKLFENAEKCFKEVIELVDINDALDKTQINTEEPDYSVLSVNTDIEKYKMKLLNCYKLLVSMQLRLDKEKQDAVRIQNQFQTVLLDCNSTLIELESLMEESAQGNLRRSGVISETVQRTSGDYKTEENSIGKSLVEAERKQHIIEGEYLEESKKSIIEMRKNLEMEYKALNEAKELLQQERISLKQEKTSLDQQSQLYEDHEKSFQMEKKMLELKQDQLSAEINKLGEELQKKELQIVEQHTKIEQTAVEVSLLISQLSLYEEDFKHERKVKENLFEEKGKLHGDIQKQMEFNKQLQKEIYRLKMLLPGGEAGSGENFSASAENTLTPPQMSSFQCPMCGTIFRSVDALQSHVQTCLNLE